MKNLINDVARARSEFILSTSMLTQMQAEFKPSPEEWSVIDNVEHMVWAELGGINGMWKAAEGIRQNRPIWVGENPNEGLSIEKIIDRTWQPKEKVPETAKPRWGGPLHYWIISLENCQMLLEAFVHSITDLDVEKIIYPHIISGPLTVRQRLEFLRFHLDRHRDQIERIKSHIHFPRS